MTVGRGIRPTGTLIPFEVHVALLAHVAAVAYLIYGVRHPTGVRQSHREPPLPHRLR